MTTDTYRCPDWYSYHAACEWLHVDVTRTDIPEWWINKAYIAMEAEHSAREQLKGQGQ